MELEVARHQHRQAGVISRRQAMTLGLGDHDIRRLVRRREWAVLHPGVYVWQTGPPSWEQRAWGAVLLAWPSALYGESVLLAADGPSHVHDSSPVHVAVDRHRRRLAVPPGLRLHHVNGLQDRVLWNLGPPRMRYEDAVLDVSLAARRDIDAIAVLAQACQARRTTAARLLQALAERPRVRRRRWLEAVLRDVAEGTCSALEHGFATLVERPHGLPRARRQHRAMSSLGVVYRDALLGETQVVELDGRLFHDTTTTRDADFERDLDAALEGRSTARLSWGQVFDRPCSTAGKLAGILALRGVPVDVGPCGPECPVNRTVLVGRDPAASVPPVAVTW